MFLGNWDIDDYLTFTACTHDDTGAAADADAVPSYAIYEDETAAAIVSGNMTRLGAVTGFYTERVQLTAAAGFEAGKMYAIRVEAVMGGVMAAAAHSFAVKVASANVTEWKGSTAPAMTGDAYAVVTNATYGLDKLARTGADGDTLETLSDQLDGIGSITAQEVRDAMKLAPSAGDPAAGSVDAHLDDILEDTGTTLPGLFAASGASVTVISAVDGGTITLRVGDTWSFTVTDATLDLSDYETIGLVVKRSDRQTDNEALLYLRSDTGLQRIGGAAPALAANGTLSKTATSFSALVKLAETSASGLRPGSYTWWLKVFDTTPDPDEAFTLVTGAFVLERAGLAAVA